MQGLYQWQQSRCTLQDINPDFLLHVAGDRVDKGYFFTLLHGVVEHVDELDELLAPHLSRPLTQLDPVERGILWVGAYELRFQLDVHQAVIINEAVELAKRFGAEQGHKFVNGVLDKLARQLRSAPMG